MKRSSSASLIGTAALLLAPAVHAKVTIDASAFTQYEYDSNVFDLAPGLTAPGYNHPDPSDTLFMVGGKFSVADLIGQQKLFIDLSGSELRYDRFTDLNHSDYTVDGGWAWRLGSDWDGLLEVSRLRAEVPFTYLVTTQLFLETEQRETAGVNWQVNPDFRIEGTAFTRKLDLPQQQAQYLRLTEDSGQLAFKYTGISRTTAGLMVNYLTGTWDNTGLLSAQPDFAPTYHQTTVGLTSTYSISGLTSLDGQIGYTRRRTPLAAADDSGVTGDLHFKRALTAKTSIDLEFSRVLSSYLTGVGSELDSLANLKLRWEITRKLIVDAAYTYTYRQLPNQGFVPGTDRLDHLQSTSLELNYLIRPWFTVKPYARYQSRSSDYPNANFTGSTFGVNVNVEWQKK